MTTLWTVAAARELEVARRMRDHLVAQGFAAAIEGPTGDPPGFGWVVDQAPGVHYRVRVPVAQHRDAHFALAQILTPDTGGYLTPARVTYFRTNHPFRFVRVTFSPTVACEVVEANFDRREFTARNTLSPETMEAVRAAAEAAGLRLKTPNACMHSEEWYE
ncbi:MAG: hypothetical protein CW346_19535, partial [Bacillaceae bacterium]|nr:hypothetical protein [Bacillaceae bacterium]